MTKLGICQSHDLVKRKNRDVDSTLIRDPLRLAHDSAAHQLNIGTVKIDVSNVFPTVVNWG